jgi:stalled ribosome rescue protein Dom34
VYWKKENAMKTTKGLWIDHRRTVIVTATDKGEEVKEILSHVEKQLGRIEGTRSTTPYEAQLVPADDSQERSLTGRLDKYYDEIISHLRDAKVILIFGPGEAKGELVKRIERDKLSERIVHIETAKKLTVPQIAARVRRYLKNNVVVSNAA